MRGEPFHQRAADVQRNLQRRVAAENVQEGAIAVVERLLEDVVEVADGLVVVQGQDQTDAVGHDASVAGLLGVGWNADWRRFRDCRRSPADRSQRPNHNRRTTGILS